MNTQIKKFKDYIGKIYSGRLNRMQYLYGSLLIGVINKTLFSMADSSSNLNKHYNTKLKKLHVQ